MAAVRQAVRAYLRGELSPDDVVAVIVPPNPRRQLTPDEQMIQDSLDEVDYQADSWDDVRSMQGRMTHDQYDALVAAYKRRFG